MLLIIIQARTSSKRLPGKVLLKLRNKTILEIIIQKLQKIRIKKKIYIVTSKNKNDDPIEKIAKKNNINLFRGSLNNVASRYYNVILNNSEFEYFLRVNCDSPFLDIKIINLLLKKIKEKYDIITNVKIRTFPKGQSVELVSSKFFLKNYKKIVSLSDKEHVTKKLYKLNKSKIFNYKLSKDFSRYSLALDDKKDKSFITFYFNKYKKIFNWHKILNLRINYEKN